MDHLADFLQGSAGQRFDWQQLNCGLWMCQWVKIRTGIDLVAPERAEAERTGWRRVTARRGGLEHYCAYACRRAGLKSGDDARGHIAVLATADGVSCGILLGEGRAARKTDAGVMIDMSRPLPGRVWAV